MSDAEEEDDGELVLRLPIDIPVTRFLNAHSVDRWQRAFAPVTVNRYQDVTLLALFEGMKTLVIRRDAIDDLRSAIHTSGRPFGFPTATAQMELSRVVAAFFDAYYSTVSKLSAVVARFADVFHKNFSDNGPFVSWLVTRYELDDEFRDGLESARLFRAILAHPQQFPAHEWATVTDETSGGLIRFILKGPHGRGKNPVPAGATDNGEDLALLGEGWHFLAPDEVNVTNILGMTSELVLRDVLAAYSERSAFTPTLTRDEALEKLSASGTADLSEDARRVSSLYDSPSMMPSLKPKPWGGSTRAAVSSPNPSPDEDV